MLTTGEFMDVMGAIAPLEFAEAWDNVGLILGDPARPISGPVLLTIDLTPGVVAEAREMSASLILSYHPPIFSGLKRITPGSPHGIALLGCMNAGIGIYSPHTALDAAPGGVADWLLDSALGSDAPGAGRAALQSLQRLDPAQTHKLVVFVPTEPASLLGEIRAALSAAGAGVIGEYSQCSYSLRGKGSFFGSESTDPAVGARGTLEEVDEVRLEMVCPAARLPGIIDTLRRVHPYEEPAYDLYALSPAPDARIGPGRVASLGAETEVNALADRLKAKLGAPCVRFATHMGDRVSRVAVCPGSGESLIDNAMTAGADVFVTGEMKHHEILGAVERGIAIVLAGHTETERGYLHELAGRLSGSGVRAEVSKADRPPLSPPV